MEWSPGSACLPGGRQWEAPSQSWQNNLLFRERPDFRGLLGPQQPLTRPLSSDSARLLSPVAIVLRHFLTLPVYLIFPPFDFLKYLP